MVERQSAEEGWRTYSFSALGSKANSISVAQDSSCQSSAAASQAISAAVCRVLQIEKKYSRYRSDSVIAEINATADTHVPVRVDEETACLLSFAQELFTSSDGLIDPTSGVLRRIWDFSLNAVPCENTIRDTLPLIGWQYVQFKELHVMLTRAGMELDFGGFGKEYAVECAVSELRRCGISRGIVDLGGDVKVFGDPPSGRAEWCIGVRNPREHDDQRSSCSASVMIKGNEGRAVATSGDYIRSMLVGRKRFFHIFNPKTGWAAQTGMLRSVTVSHASCIMAGFFSTLSLLKDSIEWIPGSVQALGVAVDGTILESLVTKRR